LYIGCSASAALILSVFKNFNTAMGFCCIFFLAFLFRLWAARFVSKMQERPRKVPFDMFSFVNFLKGITRSNFGRFTSFQAALNFSNHLAAPYFAVYMLRELNFSYVNYMAVIIAGTVTMFSLSRRWGVQADDVGNIAVVKLTSLFMPIIPLIWLLSNNVFYLIGVQVLSGFLWSGYMISSSNFVFDAVPGAKRACSISYFNVVNGAAICAGALIGGFLIDFIPIHSPLPGIPAVFVMSSAMRFLFRLLMSRGIKEVRTSRSIPAIYLFSYVGGIRPLLGFTRGVNRIMRRIFSA
jgi:hypothetical protein